MDFNKNNLIDETLDRFFETFQHTLDTADFVPAAYGKKIDAYIFKNMKAAFRRINREDRAYRRQKRKERLEALRAEKQVLLEKEPSNVEEIDVAPQSEKTSL